MNRNNIFKGFEKNYKKYIYDFFTNNNKKGTTKCKSQNYGATGMKINVFGYTIYKTKKLQEILQNKDNCIKNLRERINTLYYG